MALEKISSVTGRGVFVPGNDIDTDRIIPARFLRCVTFDGLGEHAFRDERTADESNHRFDCHDLSPSAGCSGWRRCVM